jgi:hypothetical protein
VVLGPELHCEMNGKMPGQSELVEILDGGWRLRKEGL